jgi:hypothetical protein
MTAYEHNYRLKELRATCAMNALYHQAMEARCNSWDSVIRIAVMVLAVAGLIFAFPDLTSPWIGFGVSVAALVAAAVLNIVPVGDWAKRHGEMYRLWCDLRGDADREYLKTCEVSDDTKVLMARSERLEDLWGKVPALNAGQKAPNKKLLYRCHDEARRQIGYDPCPPPTSPSGAPEASPAGAGV